jgi:membrane protease subunit HflK
MIMERSDENRTAQKDFEETGMDERNAEAIKPARHSWKKRILEIVQKALLLSRALVRKVKEAYIKLFKPKAEVGLIDDIKGAFRHIPLRKKGVSVLLAVLILSVYLLSGVYTVRPGEVAVSTIFGKEVRQAITEGLHYRLPWPFEAIEKINVSEIRRIDMGVTSSEESLLFPKKRLAELVPNAGGHSGHGSPTTISKTAEVPKSKTVVAKNQFFTGDENILEIRMNIQYQIQDASNYLFNMNSPDSLVPEAARAAVTEFFGLMPVEDLLTVAKSQIQKQIAQKTQSMLDDYGTGLYIVSVNLQEVNPPKEVAEAFRDVASAREQREETINKAQGYRNTVIPESRGNAHKLISDAEGYSQETINQARGDADKFSIMLAEYRRAKTVTEYRLYLETMEIIMAKAKKFVIDSKKQRVNLKFIK